jgi:hypothetical protein
MCRIALWIGVSGSVSIKDSVAGMKKYEACLIRIEGVNTKKPGSRTCNRAEKDYY